MPIKANLNVAAMPKTKAKISLATRIAAVFAMTFALLAWANKAERGALRVHCIDRELAARDLDGSVQHLAAAGLHCVGCAVDVVDADVIGPLGDRQLRRLGHDGANVGAVALDEAVFAHLAHVHVAVLAPA